MLQSKQIWWKEYRHRQFKPRTTLTLERVVRKSFLEVFKEYIHTCSISGVSAMCDPKLRWPQRLVRTAVLFSMFGLYMYLLYYTWCGILTHPLIVMSESSTYPIRKIDFPAVALCNVNRISKKALKEFTEEFHPKLGLHNVSIEEFARFVKECGRLLDFSYDDKRTRHIYLDNVMTKSFSTRAIIAVMKRLAPPCSEMLVRCVWAGVEVNCSSVFAVRRTARGHCCAFNYILDYDSAASPNSTIGVAKRQILPGRTQGLIVVLDPMLDDYAFPLNNFVGFDVLLFDPTHFADLSAGRVTHRVAEPNQAEFMELKSIRQVASAEVRKYPLNVRKCLFKDESRKNDMNSMYSYSACIVNCRIKSVQTLCKCTPYFLPIRKDQGPICNLVNLECLNKYKEKLLYLYPIDAEKTDGLEVEIEDSLFCPDCLPDCELTAHFTKSYKIPTTMIDFKKFYSSPILQGINVTNKSILSIYHVASDGILDRLDVVSYWFEVLSSIGGFGGVLVGFSIVSGVEFVYFLVVRFVTIIRYNYKKYH